MLNIHNLHVRVGGKPILQGIGLRVNAGEVHAIMGPNGSGKSTLARALSGHPDYQVTEGEVLYEGRDLLAMDPEERAREGVFMAFQYPVEIPGVNNAYFLKAALNAIRKHRGQEELDAIEFMALMREKSTLLEIDPSMLTRSVNEGFSGGEKKRNEIFQMAVLEPKLAILDETDSGLDIDALKLVANGVNAMRSPERAIIVVTHYQRLLDYIVPDVVHVLSGGRIVKSGDRALALELEDKGYGWLEPEAAPPPRPRKRKGIRMTRLVQSTPQIDAYLADCDRLASAGSATEPAWLRNLRRKGIEHFADAGFPTTRDEEWKFTSVASIADRHFAPAHDGQSGLAADLVERWAGAFDGYRVVLVNGAYAPQFSVGALPAGVHVSGLRSILATNPAAVEPYLGRFAPPDRQGFTALNTGFLQDGAFVWIPPGTIVEQPISLLFVSASPEAASVSHPRVLIVAGDRSQARIVEGYAGRPGQEYFTNAVTEVVVGSGAVVDHYKVQRESQRAYHIGSMYVHGTRDSTFLSHSIAFGGALVRNDVIALLDGEGGDCTLNGLYLVDGRRLIDNHTTIDHAKPHCGSHEMYKGILSGHARAVFNGKIIVRPDAQKTDAKQTNKALLLSDDAQINTKPQLEIFANDVKCTHGAAVGQLDEDALFYLRARGLDRQQARDMLIHAFAGDVLNRIRIDGLRKLLEEHLLSELPTAGGPANQS